MANRQHLINKTKTDNNKSKQEFGEQTQENYISSTRNMQMQNSRRRGHEKNLEK
jgi:hypothetical protein